MTDEETRLLEHHGITHEVKSIFHYRGYKYDRLDDAIRYAEKVGSEQEAQAPMVQLSDK